MILTGIIPAIMWQVKKFATTIGMQKTATYIAKKKINLTDIIYAII